MGGPGSGAYMRVHAKPSTADALRFDIRELHRGGFLEPGAESLRTYRSAHGEWHVGCRAIGDERTHTLRLVFQTDGEIRKQDIALEWTPCHLGGERPWGTCPTCRRRLAVLYYRHGRFRCRQCHGLAYASTREDKADRGRIRAQAIRRQLGGSPSLAEPFPGKPKGMRWRTYWRLFDEAQRGERRWIGFLSSSFQKFR